MRELSPETREIVEFAVAAGQPLLGAQVALGRMSEELARSSLGMPPSQPRAAAHYAPSDENHVLCPVCGGSGEVVADDPDVPQDDARSQPGAVSAEAMAGWAKAFSAVHGAHSRPRG